MNTLAIDKIVERSLAIRSKYHLLEEKNHGSRWSVEEDALAFLTDAALVGRLTMSQQGHWPASDKNSSQLKHKLAESIWWIFVLSDRMEIDINETLEIFLEQMESKLAGVA